MELEGHAHAGRHHLVEEVHVGEDPFIAGRSDPEVALEEGVQTVQEGLQAAEREREREREAFRQGCPGDNVLQAAA